MDPSKKVALLFGIFGEDVSAEILKHLPQDTLKRVLQAMQQMTPVSEADLDAVAQEFLSFMGKNGSFSQGVGANLEKVMRQASKFIQDPDWFRGTELELEVERIRQDAPELPVDAWIRWLQNERIPISAVILSLLDAPFAAKIFKGLGTEIQTTLVETIPTLGPVDSDVIAVIRKSLKEQLQLQATRITNLGGMQRVAELVKGMTSEAREALLEKVEKANDVLAQAIRKAQLSLDQLKAMSGSDFAKVLGFLKDRELAILCAKESESFREKVFQSVSANRRAAIEAEIQVVGLVKRVELEALREKVIAIAVKLREEGKVIFPWEDQVI